MIILYQKKFNLSPKNASSTLMATRGWSYNWKTKQTFHQHVKPNQKVQIIFIAKLCRHLEDFMDQIGLFGPLVNVYNVFLCHFSEKYEKNQNFTSEEKLLHRPPEGAIGARFHQNKCQKSKMKKHHKVMAKLSSIFVESEQNKLKTKDFTCSFQWTNWKYESRCQIRTVSKCQLADFELCWGACNKGQPYSSW